MKRGESADDQPASQSELLVSSWLDRRKDSYYVGVLTQRVYRGDMG